MKYESRWYQEESVGALWDAVTFSPDKNPVIAIPTGGGKTVIMGMFIKKYLETYPDNRVIVLSHTRDILEQDHAALQNFFPDREIGLYSAGLNSKTLKQITVAGIQSIYKKKDLVKWTNLYLVDECHTINHKAEGMYRTLLDDTKAIVTGMSATCYRTGHGLIYEGKSTLFDSLAYDLTSVDNFNRLVDEGYLTKLIAVSPEMKMNVDGVRKQGGDYNQKQLSKKFDKETITNKAVKETIKYGKNYSKWLIFAIDINHADHICDTLRSLDISADVLHSRMSRAREEVTKDFKDGELRALVSVGMVTTGFDAPNIDLLVLLRPTLSATLHVQMVGRGLRIAPNKSHCLVLDFAGNTARLGPINDVKIPNKKGKGNGEVPTKTCPNCSTIMYASARACSTCGHEFEFESKLTTKASEKEIVAKSKEPEKQWRDVQRVSYQIHNKKGSPSSLLVNYHCGLNIFKEWVCLNHKGYAKRKADHWVKYRGYKGELNLDEVFKAKDTLKVPTQIEVTASGKYFNITNARF